MRRREQERPPRPPLPEQLRSFEPADWGCFEVNPHPAWREAFELWRAALFAWCDEHGTDPLELLRDRRDARLAANPDHYLHVPNRRNPG